MVKAVVAEETLVQRHVDDLFRRRCPSELGLIIGKRAVGARDLILSLIRTPPREDDAAVESDNALNIDAEWIGEHARQVGRMLPGGIQVVGMYAFTSDAQFKAATPRLVQALRAVAAAGWSKRPKSEAQDSLLLHISTTTRKYAAKSCTTGASSPDVKPCEFKMQAGVVLSNLQKMSCQYSLDIRWPIAGSGQEELHRHAYAMLQAEAACLQLALLTINGATAKPDEQVASALGDAGEDAEIDIYVPPFLATTNDSDDQPLAGQMRLTGSIHAVAYAHSRATWDRAAADLKDDILNSLHARLELLVEDAEANSNDDSTEATEAEQQANDQQGQAASHPLLCAPQSSSGLFSALPQRVEIAWHPSLVLLDYMLPSETLEDVSERCRAMLGLELPGDVSSVLRILEDAPSTTDTPQPWRPEEGLTSDVSSKTMVPSEELHATMQQIGGATRSVMRLFTVAGAVIALLLAVAIGLLLR